MTSERGFSLVELLIAVAVIGIVAGIGIGVSNTLVRVSRGESGAQQLEAFLRRHREMAVARRRDIEIRFIAPNQVQSAVRAVPDPPAATPAPTVLETITFEGGIGYRLYPGVPDTPNVFGNGLEVTLGGPEPVMFSSEGAFVDANSNPINATIQLGMEGDSLTASAVTVLGATATIERFRWDGVKWTR